MAQLGSVTHPFLAVGFVVFLQLRKGGRGLATEAIPKGNDDILHGLEQKALYAIAK